MTPVHPGQRDAPFAAGGDESMPATRVVFEGEDAVEKVAKLLGSRSTAGTTALSNRLRELAEALERSGGNLRARLEQRVQSLGEHQSEALAQVKKLEAQDPEAFLAGALAGFALAGATGPSEASMEPEDEQRHRPEHNHHRESGVEKSPVDTAQIGPGGLGSLEAPDTDPPPEPSPEGEEPGRIS